MIERYFPFDIDGFFADYQDNKTELESLKITLQSMSDTVKGTSYDGVKVTGGEHGDPTAALVDKRLAVERKIDDLRAYFRLYDKLIKQLTEDEAMAIFCYYNHVEMEGFSKASFYRELQSAKTKIRMVARWL